MGKNRERFVDVSIRNPCPICGRTNHCTLTRDGELAMCRHNDVAPDGTPGKPRNGKLGMQWHYRLQPDHPTQAPRIDSPPTREVAPVDVRSEVYNALLDRLDLADDHRHALTDLYPTGRGLPVENVLRFRHKTLRRDRPRVAGELARLFGDEVLAKVPGFHLVKVPGKASYWNIAGDYGLLIPSRDVQGRIERIHIRVDDSRPERKYIWLASTKFDGPHTESSCHVPVHGDIDTSIVRITEGLLKADAAMVLDSEHILTLGIPGVDSWGFALPVLKELAVQKVRLAFDADFRTKANVALALRDCAKELVTQGYRCQFETWDGAKGIDDAMAAGRPITVSDQIPC